MKVAVLGTGALGLVFAARLASHGEITVLGTWAEGIAAIRERGIRVMDADGSVAEVLVSATTEPSDCPPADLALVLVKSYQTPRAAAWAAQILRHDGLALTLQNGLDNGSVLAAAVGDARCAVGVTYNGATLLGPGEARHAAHLPSYLGTAPATAERVEAAATLLAQAGFEAHVTADILPRLWGKAVANAAINPLTALWRVPNGGVCVTPARCEILAVLAREAAAVANANGITLLFDDPAGYVADICRGTAANRSSMLQDVERGRPTEIDSINGAVVRAGAHTGVATPYNEIIWRLVRALEPAPAQEETA